MENIDETLAICSVGTCRRIRIGDKTSRDWLSEEMSPDLYERLIKKYKGKLSHTYCPEHTEELLSGLEKNTK
jgi:hypothetical protein